MARVTQCPISLRAEHPIDACSDNRMKHVSTLCGQNKVFLHVKACGNHFALEGYVCIRTKMRSEHKKTLPLQLQGAYSLSSELQSSKIRILQNSIHVKYKILLYIKFLSFRRLSPVKLKTDDVDTCCKKRSNG
jgi:hypothetical protein